MEAMESRFTLRDGAMFVRFREVRLERHRPVRSAICDEEACPFLGLAGNNKRVNERTDSDLLRDYAENGSEPAFAELVRRHIALVYSSALRMVVDPYYAEDVTQATFATLARQARRLTGRALLSGWLHRTASNLAAKLVRGEMRRRAREH